MKKAFSFLLILLFFTSLNAQRLHVGVFSGLAAYNGDLTEKIFPKKVTNGSIGITGSYEILDQILLRAGFTYAVVGGADRFSTKPDAVLRNLAFETTITEFSLLGEYYLFNLYEKRYSPYGFVGLAVFHFDPYAFQGSTQKIYLKPLSTEGQGLAAYPDRKPYNLTQLAIPFGGGVKFAVTENFRVGLEMGIRYTMTDYLDDVSKNYIDPNDLLAAKGQLAVDMSYRGDELTNGSPIYPPKAIQRGSPASKDIYYFAGLHLTYGLGSGSGGSGAGRSNKSRMGCPVNVY
jgi:hypothetical protein